MNADSKKANYGQYQMQQFNKEYDQYMDFLVTNFPLDPALSAQRVAKNLEEHEEVLKSMGIDVSTSGKTLRREFVYNREHLPVG
jgi:hypothetical protein